MKNEDTKKKKKKKKKRELPPSIESRDEEQELEILKAVAQAWHGHSANPRPTTEFDASRSNDVDGDRTSRRPGRPTRFRVESMRWREQEARSTWDFSQSLWDSYEILTVSKKLESNLILHHDQPIVVDESRGKIPRESNNSLRRLFRSSSKDFDDDDDDDDDV